MLGQGAFGVVLKAFDEMLHRVVAIKVLSGLLASTSPARKRFLREARAAAAVRHENVVAIHAVEEKPLPYLVMEYVPGETLQQKLDRAGPLKPAEVVRISQQIADGLAAAHAQGLIHRDIKPGNILLDEGVEPKVKISDFGLARTMDDASLTQSGIIAGTPLYMAPEQAQGESFDHRADLFSLGSVLYTMVSGRPPFRAAGTLAVLKRVVEDTPRPIQEIIPEVPGWLCALIVKLHAKKPGERLQTAKEVARLLKQEQSGLDQPPPCPPAPTLETKLLPVPAQRQPRRSLRRLVQAAVLLLLALAGLGLTDAAGLTHVRGTVIQLFSPAGTRVVEAEHRATTQAPGLAIAPFDAKQARTHQEAWAKYLRVPVETANVLGMNMILLPPGEFLMGSTDEEVKLLTVELPEGDKVRRQIQSEAPQHKVTLTKPFRMGATEVTIGQFRHFVERAKYQTEAEKSGNGWGYVQGELSEHSKFIWSFNYDLPDSDRYPVCNVTWEDAAAFCAWLSGYTGQPYRLPSEAEWEYACRAGTQTTYYFGAERSQGKLYEWCKEEFQHEKPLRHNRPVAQKRPNPFGLYDMLGNVYEYCEDHFALTAYTSAPAVDPRGPAEAKNRQRVIRTSMSRTDLPIGRCAQRRPTTVNES